MPDTKARLAALEARLDELESMEAIRQGLFRYAHATDCADVEMLRSCYHPDARDNHGVFNGNAMEFCDFILPEMQRYRSVRHTVTNPRIELRGDSAFVESYFFCVLVLDVDADVVGSGGNEYVEQVSFGRYLDIWERRAGEWKIAHRQLVSDGRTNRLITDQPKPAAADPGTTGAWGKADPSCYGFDLKALKQPDRRMEGFPEALRDAFREQLQARKAVT